MFFTGDGARRKESEPSKFLDDIPQDIVKYIDKTTPGAKTRVALTARGGGSSNRYSGAKSTTSRRGGGGGKAAPAAQRHRSRSATTGQRTYYGDNSNSGRRDGGEAGEEHPLDFTAKLFKDVRPPGAGLRSASGSTPRKSVSGPTRGTHGYSGGYGGATKGTHGYSGGGSSDARPASAGLSEGERRMQAFREARSRDAKHRYPTNPVVRAGGVKREKDTGAGIDTSWAAKLADKPSSSVFGVCVGAKVGVPSGCGYFDVCFLQCV